MKRFSELNVVLQDEPVIYECPVLRINNILNCEIQILEYIKNINTEHGGDRYLIKGIKDNKEFKLFTNSVRIKKTLDAISPSDFPFTTTLRSKTLGKTEIYVFT